MFGAIVVNLLDPYIPPKKPNQLKVDKNLRYYKDVDTAILI